jgi:ABC-type antimicrobial peptide transport system permease subunit
MTLYSFFLILRRQLTQKWGRFLLASGGIMIGIWAISLTTSLSLGVSDALVKAINSQAFAKQITLSKTSTNQTSYFDVTSAPKFVPIATKDLPQIKSDHSNIVDIATNVSMNVFLHKDQSDTGLKCVEQDVAAKAQANLVAASATNGSTSVVSSAPVTDPNCISATIDNDSFGDFYESNKRDWVGSTDQPGRNQIVVCFKCGNTNLGQSLGASQPQDLVGKTITLELQQAPKLYEGGSVVDVQNPITPKIDITKSQNIDLTISAVVDDRNASVFGGGSYYLDYSYFQDAFKAANPGINPEDYGGLQNTVYIDSYQNLDKVVNDLRADQYLTFSLAQTVIQGVNTGFLVLTVALSLLGFIALIASVFGIVNVMTISVLERQKEIGVLKSLGARDGDIFNIFLLESSLLGFIGWILGIILAVAMGNLISFVFMAIINSNADWKSNLDSLNLTSFTPSFPWWLLLGTLGIALLFTILSGVFPAIKASKQNPVDVLRSE